MATSEAVIGPMVELSRIENGTDEVASEEGCQKCKYDPNFLEANFIFDSLSIQFHFLVFIKQLLAHTIIPLCFIFTNYKGQGFVRNTFFALYLNVIIPVLVYTMVISYFLCSEDTQHVITGAFWIPLLYFLQHKLVVSLKYATLSKKEYKKFQDCKCNQTCDLYNSQMQLLSSWSKRDQKVLEFEIASAALRIGAKINEINFNIPNVENLQNEHQKEADKLKLQENLDDIMTAEPLHGVESMRSNYLNWNAFVRGNEKIDTSLKPAREFFINDSGNYSISVFDVACAIVRQADSFDFNKQCIEWIIYVGVVVTLLIPFLHIATTTEPYTLDAPLVIFLVSSTWVNYIFGRVAYTILCVAIWDVYRMVNMVKTLHILVRLTDLTLESDVSFGSKNAVEKEEVSNIATIMSITDTPRRRAAKTGWRASQPTAAPAQPSAPTSSRISIFGEYIVKDHSDARTPRIDFDCPHNVISWTYTRLIIQNFGERYRFRIDMYTGGTIVLMLVLMVIALVTVILAADRNEAFGSCMFQQSLVAVLLILLFLLSVSTAGAMVNEELSLHSRTLTAHALQVRRRILLMKHYSGVRTEQVDQEIETLELIADNIDSTMNVTDVYTSLKPFKIFGFEANSSVTMSIITTAISFFGVLMSLYSSDGAATAGKKTLKIAIKPQRIE